MAYNIKYSLSRKSVEFSWSGLGLARQLTYFQSATGWVGGSADLGWACTQAKGHLGVSWSELALVGMRPEEPELISRSLMWICSRGNGRGKSNPECESPCLASICVTCANKTSQIDELRITNQGSSTHSPYQAATVTGWSVDTGRCGDSGPLFKSAIIFNFLLSQPFNSFCNFIC